MLYFLLFFRILIAQFEDHTYLKLPPPFSRTVEPKHHISIESTKGSGVVIFRAAFTFSSLEGYAPKSPVGFATTWQRCGFWPSASLAEFHSLRLTAEFAEQDHSLPIIASEL